MRARLVFLLVLTHLLAPGCGGNRKTPAERGGSEAVGLARPEAAWLEGLGSADEDERHDALVKLATWYEEEPEGVIEREEARDQLMPVLEHLARIASDEEVDCSRWNAVLLLGEMGYRALAATDALIHASQNADPELRELAVKGLARVASPRKGLLSGLRDIVRKAVSPEKRAILERWDPADPERAFGAPYTAARDKALAAVAARLKDEAPAVARAAVHELGSWGPDAVHLTKDVLPFLRDESRDVRQNALYTLRALKPPASLVLQPYIDFIRTTERSSVRGIVMIQGAILGLEELGPDAIEALDFLHRIAKDARLASQAKKAIRKIEAGLSVVDEPPRQLPDPRRLPDPNPRGGPDDR